VSGKQVADTVFAREGGSDRRLEKTANCKSSYLHSALTIPISTNKDEIDGHAIHKEKKNNSKEISSTKLKH
jgi:hypothetical protein